MAGTVHAHNGGFRVRWTFAGARQSFTHANPDVVAAAKAHVEGVGNRMAADDHRLTTLALVAATPKGDAPEGVYTLAQGFADYLAGRVLTARSLAKREGVYGTHLSAWDARPMSSIDVPMVVAWVGRMRAAGLSEATVYNAFGLLAGIYRQAVHAGKAPAHVPALARPRVRIRKGTRAAEKFLTHDEWLAFDAALARPALAMMCRVAANTGMRWGEVAGLTPADMRLSGPAPYVMVRRSIGDDGNGAVTVNPPKSESDRDVPVTLAFARELAAYVAGMPATAWVFTSPRKPNAPMCYSNWHQREWQGKGGADAAAASLGRDVSGFHALRHSHGSWLVAAGVPLLEVSRRLGHDSIVTTANIYGHIDPSADNRARAALDALSPSRPALALVAG